MAALSRSKVGVQPGRLVFSHALIDQRNAEDDRLIARRLRREPRILRQAKANLRRWMRQDGKRVRPVFAEWQRLLNWLSAGQLAEFLLSETPMARRLRQSSPFLGPLSAYRQGHMSRRE